MRTMTIGIVIAALMLVSGCKETGQSTGKDSSTAQMEGKSLTLESPKAVTIARGATEDVTITLKRKNYPDTVTVKFENVPKGVHVVNAPGVNVTAGPVHIDLGHEAKIAGDQAIYALKADPDAALGNSEMQFTAKGPDDKIVTTSLKVTIIEKP